MSNAIRQKKPNKSFKAQIIKGVLWVIVLFLIVSGITSLLEDESLRDVENEDVISLSLLVESLKEGAVEAIFIEGNDLTIEFLDGSEKKAIKESEASLSESLAIFGITPLELSQVSIEQRKPSGFAFWLTALLPILIPLIFIGVFIWMMSRGVKKANFQAMGFGKTLARMIRPEKDKNGKKKGITFKDVAGLKEPKEELYEVVEFLKSPKKFTDLGAKIPKGVLLVGPPGCGKTLLSRAVANEAEVPFFSMSGSEFVEMFVGVGASRVRNTFQEAKQHAPSILFIDELDAIGRYRGAGVGGGHDEREQTLNQILVEMDGFEVNKGIIVMGATNRPDILDPALLRPGRFDRRIVLNLPDMVERQAILKLHVKNKPVAKGVRLKNIAERTPGFSGADLENLVNEAAILSARGEKKEIGMKELRDSIEKVLLGPERKSRVISKSEKKITAYHEAGHALLASSLRHADPVQKVTIIPRGQAGGYTLKTPIKERSLRSKKEFLAELAVLLGGYVAESIVFKDITTGASNDLANATSLARKMVTEYGMSSLGPVQYKSSEEMVFLGRELSSHKHYSEKKAEEIDREVARLIEGARGRAEKVLLKKKDLLDRISKELMEKEVLEKEEYDSLLKKRV